ncbi:hypothetical protein TFKS16_0086 [Tannerella forsythia KS16]|uniref:Uncharacterized protein n=1 Tax=Tannerella forsythia (strain ATCC 43037 / JCM 10827 / CCUG 21028 A / KCTC 5666 / FDC 338) TaxID=203275 RepID=G8UHJ3_TANFA|nr:hypothetical protein BFO_0071 [Tannerella forsythia 92A2]BAR50441.1 hypothetical protein TFKS16_0086 [Tannerella forsythia KS16]
MDIVFFNYSKKFLSLLSVIFFTYCLSLPHKYFENYTKQSFVYNKL